MMLWLVLFALATCGWLLTANPRETHHYYYGALVLTLGLVLGQNVLVALGSLVCLDDALEHVLERLSGRPGLSILLWLYQRTLARIPLVRRVNTYLDRLAGKR